MNALKLLEEKCHFGTDRLQVKSLKGFSSSHGDVNALARRIQSILTPAVTESLPDEWQEVSTIEKAQQWLAARIKEGAVFTIQTKSEASLVGFLFLNVEEGLDARSSDVLLGYLLAEEAWGEGLGSELVAGLVRWCEEAGFVASLAGGVDIENAASRRVLEKNGFKVMDHDELSSDVLFLKRMIK